MNNDKKQRFIIGLQLLLTGILIGTIITILVYRQNFVPNEKVAVTRIKQAVPDSSAVGEVNTMPGSSIHMFNAVAKRVIPTVVYVEASIPINRSDMPEDQNHRYGNQFWRRFFPHSRIRTVGSGVIITPDGYILTNNHVVDNAAGHVVQVTLPDKRIFKGTIVGQDPSTDLAVVKIDAHNLPSIVVGNSDDVEVGDWVLAVGNPFQLRSTVTAGIVSALGRDVSVIDDPNKIEDFIQTDAAINKGNSGGALVNIEGQLVGINTAIASETGNYEGYGFAIPSNVAIKVARDIIQYGKAQRPFLGVRILSVNDQIANNLGMKQVEGVKIVNVLVNGPAYHAGVKPNDVVLAIDGNTVNSYNQLQARIAEKNPGDIVTLDIWRGGNTKKIHIKLVNMGDTQSNKWVIPETDQNNIEFPDSSKNFFRRERFDLGFSVIAIADSNDINKSQLIISHVDNNSEAERRGLKEGYVIKDVNGNAVNSLKDLRQKINDSLDKRKSVMLKIEKNDGIIGYYELKQYD